jgi:hypothetical protein
VPRVAAPIPADITVSACQSSFDHLFLLRVRRGGGFRFRQRLELPRRHIFLLHRPLHHRDWRQAAAERRCPRAAPTPRVLSLPLPRTGRRRDVLQSSARRDFDQVQTYRQQHGPVETLVTTALLFIFGTESDFKKPTQIKQYA